MASVDQSIVRKPHSKAELELLESGKPSSKYGDGELRQLAATFLTTLSVFGVYFCQGILIARVLGPMGRGEFGTAMFFPRDILLYVGLLGGVEIVSRYASQPGIDGKKLKYAAASLGMFSGLVTAILGAIFATVVLLTVNDGAKAYLIPYCLLICLFVPWEHIHLTVSGVDRGKEDYFRYNVNRLVFAAFFPLLLLPLLSSQVRGLLGEQILLTVCSLFVVSRIIGLLPTLRGLKIRSWWQHVTSSEKPSEQEAPQTKSLLRDGWPYAISMFATELFERMDIILILALASVQESGFYFVAVPAAALLTIAPNSLAVFAFNAGAAQKAISFRKALAVITATFVFQVVSLIILSWIIPILIVAFYGEPFRPAIDFVWYLLPAFAMKGFLQAVDGYLKGSGKPIIGVWARFLSIFVMLGFVYLFYGQMGLISIPVAACIGQAVSTLIVTTFTLKHILNLPSPSKRDGISP